MSTDEILAIGRSAGLAAVGVAPAELLQPARTVLELRKARGLAGEMQFTYRNPARSTEPWRALEGAQSLIAGAWAYGHWRAPTDLQDTPQPVADGDSGVVTGNSGAATGYHGPVGGYRGAVARYSWHNHYQDLEHALQTMARRLEELGYRARVIADSNALVDRNVAWSAGLGWYGKNSNLLLPGVGSWFVLGAVITDARLRQTGPPLADGCGSCSQCIDDCPTAAIVAPGVVDARRCLAWIVQAAGPIPLEYREAVGDRIYGCDDCQEVCPPNRALDLAPPSADGAPHPVADRDRALVDLRWILSADDAGIEQRHGRWYIAERNMDYIRRTALVVLGNVARPDGPPVDDLLVRYLGHEHSLLRGHAVWAAKRLGRQDLLLAAFADPATGTGDLADPDPDVAAELHAEVAPRFRPEDWAA